MPIPELDWPADLFDDAVAVGDDPIVSHTAPGKTQGELWAAMQRMWTGEAPVRDRPSKLSIMQISATRNAINLQRR